MDPARPTSLPATGSGGHTDFTYPVRVRRICITYSLMLGTTRLFGFVHQHGPDRRYPGQMVALRNRGERWLGSRREEFDRCLAWRRGLRTVLHRELLALRRDLF